jgi:ribosomal protein S18 acetylase RimI-like enzyme
MAKITYRRVRRDELLNAGKLIRRSFNHLRKKNNRLIHKTVFNEIPPLYEHLFKTDREGFYGAYEGARMIGFGLSIMRGRQWYLTDLFVAPGSQVKGVGRELLKKCIRYGKNRADSYALCTFSYNEVALALYSSLGMMPLYPIFAMNREVDKKLKIRPTVLKVVEDKSSQSILKINRLEKVIRGYSRLADLRFFARNKDYRIYQFYNGARWVGYSVVHKNALIGPAGSPYSKHIPDIVSESIRKSLEAGSKEVGVCIGANNGPLFDRLKSYAFRIEEMVVFLSSKPYSDLLRYVPADLGLY